MACCPALTDASLIALAQHSSMLSTLNVAGCTQFTDAGFQALARVGFPFSLLAKLLNIEWFAGLPLLGKNGFGRVRTDHGRHFDSLGNGLSQN